MNLLEKFEKQQLNKLAEKNPAPDFQAGDTLKVWVKVKEGDRERQQAFEGMCIGRKNDSINSSFTVRKVSYGEGVERVFPLYSPNIKIEVLRRGVVRRAKLYYLRDRSGKSARIAEKREPKVATEAAKETKVSKAAPAEKETASKADA